MGRTLARRLPLCAWAVGLLLTGCTTDDFLVRKEPEPPKRTFWEAFDQEALFEKYAPILRRLHSSDTRHRSCGYGSRQSGRYEAKFFDCNGSQADAQALSDVLADLMDEVRNQALACGARMPSRPRLELVRGSLRKFEFDFEQGKDKGRVIGRLEWKEGDGWRLSLQVERTLPAKD